MAYRIENQDLVIDGFENGIADSPFKGIGNMRNVNVNYYPGISYVNYKRKAATITGATLGLPRYSCVSPQGITYFSDDTGNIFKQTAADGHTFAALTGCPGTPSLGLQWWNNYLFAWTTTTLNVCGDGTGDGGITSSNWNTAAGTSGVWPISNATLTLTGTPSGGDTTATISTYTDAQGNARAFWNGPTGNYLVAFNGVTSPVVARLIQGTAAFSFAPALPNSAGSSSANVIAVNTITQGHPSLVSINDGNLYFGNNDRIGSLNLLPFQTFSKTKMNGQNFEFNSAALSLPPTEVVNCLTELVSNLLVGTNFKVYPWDRISPQWKNPIPILETINSMINILNNVYIFAGIKGNIYISNGFSAQVFKKMPDNIAGVIDPQWQWMNRGGGTMGHRQKLWFMALASNGQTGVPILEGIFSLGLTNGNGLTMETAGVLNMEAQNSFGLAAATTTPNGLLIDNPTTQLAFDNYYSLWASGGASNVGGADYNDTTLWSSNEPLIETDIIPIGTAMEPVSFTSIEFKLDQPMQSGDSITVYARKSLSDSYVNLGTTSTAVLSTFNTGTSISNWQWLQIKLTMVCNATATSSSFIPLREIRLRQ